jgi:hypothetical protein
MSTTVQRPGLQRPDKQFWAGGRELELSLADGIFAPWKAALQAMRDNPKNVFHWSFSVGDDMAKIILRRGDSAKARFEK